MNGFLYKRGRGKSLSFVKPWAYRWFELDVDGKELSYFAENSKGYKYMICFLFLLNIVVVAPSHSVAWLLLPMVRFICPQVTLGKTSALI